MNDRDRGDGHVFICYASEDSDRVDGLRRMLEDAGIPVWRDKNRILPGADWATVIRRAISDEALVFIACFSARGLSRSRSYQDEELLLAVEQLRQHSPGHHGVILTWKYTLAGAHQAVTADDGTCER